MTSEHTSKIDIRTKAGLAAMLRASDLKPAVKAMIAGLLSFIDDRQFAEYADLFSESVAALSETERGQKVLIRLGLDKVINTGKDS